MKEDIYAMEFAEWAYKKFKLMLIIILFSVLIYLMMWPGGVTFVYGVLGEKYYGDTWYFKLLSIIFPI